MLWSHDSKLDLFFLYLRYYGTNNLGPDISCSMDYPREIFFHLIQGTNNAASTSISDYSERLPLHDGIYL